MSFQALDNTKNKKEYLYGLIIGALLCVAVYRQAVGIPLLFGFLVLIGAMIKPSRNYLIIASILAIKIFIITIIIINNSTVLDISTVKLIAQREIIDIIIFFMLFVGLSESNKKGFFHICMIIFLLDFTFNIYTLIHGIGPIGFIPEKRPQDFLMRLGGLMGHPFYSIIFSGTALFCGLLYKNKWIVILCLFNILINGSQRGYLLLFLALTFFPMLYYRTKERYLKVLSLFIVIIAVWTVAYLATNYQGLAAHQERLARWSAGFNAILLNPTSAFSWVRLAPEGFPDILKIYPSIESSYFAMNAESLYLTQSVNYGLLIGLLSIGVYYYFYRKIRTQYLARPHWDDSVKLLLAYVVLIDGFLAYTMGAIWMIFFYCIFCIVPNNAKQEIIG